MKVMKVVDHGRDVVDAAEGGSVVVIADVALRPVHRLLRGDRAARRRETLARTLAALLRIRSARPAPEPLRVVLDPLSLA